jgi:hypothetical protein
VWLAPKLRERKEWRRCRLRLLFTRCGGNLFSEFAIISLYVSRAFHMIYGTSPNLLISSWPHQPSSQAPRTLIGHGQHATVNVWKRAMEVSYGGGPTTQTKSSRTTYLLFQYILRLSPSSHTGYAASLFPCKIIPYTSRRAFVTLYRLLKSAINLSATLYAESCLTWTAVLNWFEFSRILVLIAGSVRGLETSGVSKDSTRTFASQNGLQGAQYPSTKSVRVCRISVGFVPRKRS